MNSGIYKIENQVNGKVYVGSTNNFGRRFYIHKCLLHSDDHFNDHLQNSWNKHGEESFKFQIIVKISDNYLLIAEQYWIDKLNAYQEGYNIARYANRVKLSEETLNKISGENHYNWGGNDIELKCKRCGKNFSVRPHRKEAKFCSLKCAGDHGLEGKDHPSWKGGKAELECEECGKKYKVTQAKKDKSRFCSQKCVKKNLPSGEDHNNSKLSRKEAKAVKFLSVNKIFKQETIGDIYGIAQITVSNIKTGKNWSDISVRKVCNEN